MYYRKVSYSILLLVFSKSVYAHLGVSLRLVLAFWIGGSLFPRVGLVGALVLLCRFYLLTFCFSWNLFAAHTLMCSDFGLFVFSDAPSVVLPSGGWEGALFLIGSGLVLGVRVAVFLVVWLF